MMHFMHDDRLRTLKTSDRNRNSSETSAKILNWITDECSHEVSGRDGRQEKQDRRVEKYLIEC